MDLVMKQELLTKKNKIARSLILIHLTLMGIGMLRVVKLRKSHQKKAIKRTQSQVAKKVEVIKRRSLRRFLSPKKVIPEIHINYGAC